MIINENEILVREARVDEKVKINEFRSLYPFNNYENYFPDIKSQIINTLFGRKYKLYICEINAEIIGCMGLIKHNMYNSVFYVDDMLIVPKMRGMGIGKILFKKYNNIISKGKKVKIYAQVNEDNIVSKRMHDSIGNRPFQYLILYCKYKPMINISIQFKLVFLKIRGIRLSVIKQLYKIFRQIVGKDYFDIFNKTNYINFLFMRHNYREILLFLCRLLLGLNKYNIFIILEKHCTLGYALNCGKRNDIFIDPSRVDNQTIINCNQAFYDLFGSKEEIENYFYINRENSLKLKTYTNGSTKIEVLYNILNCD